MLHCCLVHTHTASAAPVENSETSAVSLKPNKDKEKDADALPRCLFPDGTTSRYRIAKTINSVHINGSVEVYAPAGSKLTVEAGESTTVKAEITGKLSGELNAQIAKIAAEIGASNSVSKTLTVKAKVEKNVSKNKTGKMNVGGRGIGFKLTREKMPTRSSSCVPEVVTSNGKLHTKADALSFDYKEF